MPQVFPGLPKPISGHNFVDVDWLAKQHHSASSTAAAPNADAVRLLAERTRLLWQARGRGRAGVAHR